MSEPTVAELQSLVADLTARLEALEAVVGARADEVPSEVLLAISAAVAAYLGKRATVKQVHLRRGSAWSAQGRSDIQHSHQIHHGVR
ncbi:hypothetical protein [Arsenicicoccus dermatophilus]|uniref:hypothetical protein n=1 Tax=Arsenicicoccus dermatophilus TaxID=1076331 RepID=UPI001F4CF324|nr:hypothetical protein [Arsenicicoccus dermatophilus]MCH8611741.1 hypothetical protein [Arsenicicoccus dermatophilus]